MASKALIFDINSTRIKEDGLTPSQITRVYEGIAKELFSAGFDERIQHSACRTTNVEGAKALLTLMDRKDKYPLFCQYKSRVHWMTCAEYSDITDAFNVHPANFGEI
jgi:virulence-associated protein VapD